LLQNHPEFDAPQNLVRLKQSGFNHRRWMAERKVDECVPAVLAMEGGPVDPRHWF
jgi:hypothetical protein